MSVHEFLVTKAGCRLDALIAEELEELTRSSAQRLIESGAVTVNGRTAKKSMSPQSGDRISITVPEPQPLDAQPEDIPLDIVYEDDSLLVVNKPRGMVVHPAAGNPNGTLVNALLHHCKGSLSGINGVIRPGIVHRIDKDTSGLLMVAKTDFAHLSLAEQIKEHSFKRQYYAVLRGCPSQDEGRVAVPLGRSPRDRKKQAPNGLNPRNAVTYFEVIEKYRGFSLVRCTLETGRTHQIRVHMAYIGHPVAGDLVYGGEKNEPSLHGQCLHAAVLGFVHPQSGEYMEFSSELPDYFSNFILKIKNK